MSISTLRPHLRSSHARCALVDQLKQLVSLHGCDQFCVQLSDVKSQDLLRAAAQAGCHDIFSSAVPSRV